MSRIHNSGPAKRRASGAVLAYAESAHHQQVLSEKLTRLDTDAAYEPGISYAALLMRVGLLSVFILVLVFGVNLAMQHWLA